jgi:hypothetical protein
MKIISINGRDGIGKTEQIKMLNGDDRFHFTGKLTDYSKRWIEFNPVDGFNWWFRDVPFMELTSIILESLKARRITYESNKININDRGSLMFKAVCAATLATREQRSVVDVINLIDGLFEDEIKECKLDENEILFIPDTEYELRIKPLINIANKKESQYLPWQTEMYSKYQDFLSYFIDHYFQNLIVDNKICVNNCIIDIHNKLRAIINQIANTNLPIICETFERLVAFGGLSESGKSSFAEQLNIDYHFYRLKIKYFNGVICNRGIESKSDILGKELLNFFQDHRHIINASIESLHSDDLPAYLKLMFGARLKIVYLDTPKEKRVRRTAKTLNVSQEEAKLSIESKDYTKLSRGADRVKDIADIVFDNICDDFQTSFTSFVDLI